MDGNFARATDDTILFFSPHLRPLLREILAGEKDNQDGDFYVLEPGTGPVFRKLSISRSSFYNLQIGTWSIDLRELDRLVLSPEIAKIYQYQETRCRGRADYERGVSSSSILRIKNSVFLITGGGTNVVTPTPEIQRIESSAILYDASTGTVIKTFQLKMPRRRHISLLINPQKVLLVGGSMETCPFLEIIDIEHTTSSNLQTQPRCDRNMFTACLDKTGACWIFGGANKTGTVSAVEKINLSNGKVSRFPDLSVPRSYNAGGLFNVNINVVPLKNGTFIISSGSQINPKFQPQSRPNFNAELYRPTLK